MREDISQDESTPAVDETGAVIVVGAGVSGCACAAVLAGAGVPVLLMNSALDVVGLPGYGPVVEWPRDPWARNSGPPLDVVDPALLHAWTRWAEAPEFPEPPEGGIAAGQPGDLWGLPPFVVVDRRALSLEVKQLLESYPHVHMRQGSAVSLRAGGEGLVEVETAFGEVFEGVACVLAVGLGMGGRITLGEQILAGARYGEVAADPLLDRLSEAGVTTEETSVEVGSWLSLPSAVSGTGRFGLGHPRRSSHASEGSCPSSGLDGRVISLRPLRPNRVPSDGFPRGPQHLGTPVPGPNSWAIVAGGYAPRLVGLFPDGVATGEWYASPGTPAALLSLVGGVETRQRHTVRGRVLAAVAGDGRVAGLERVWAAGQVAGARGYLESLISGSRVGASISEWLRDRPSNGGRPQTDPGAHRPHSVGGTA